jgi:hypothetical protein
MPIAKEKRSLITSDTKTRPLEMALVRRCTTLIVECERKETIFARLGKVDDTALAIYSTTCNTLNRLSARPATPQPRLTRPNLEAYLAQRQQQRP